MKDVKEMNRLLAYLGPPGTFSEEAAMKYCAGKMMLLRPYAAIDQILAAVEKKEVEQGLVPVENSLEGSVNLTLDLLSGDTAVKIRGELLHRVRHFLLASQAQELFKIKEVYSHPQALAQCRQNLERILPGVSCIHTASTTDGVMLVSRSEGRAVIAPHRAAKLYGLEILHEDLQDEAGNVTRFLLLALDDAPPSGDDKTSLLLGLHDRPGSLYRLLGIFARYDLNLTKIESRPVRGDLGRYIFFVDVEGHRFDERVDSALGDVLKEALFLKILGSYPRAGRG